MAVSLTGLPPLSSGQQIAYDAILNSQGDCILTGAAGTGKSRLIKALCETGDYVLTATTGMAAINIGGITVDKLINFDRRTGELRNERNTVGKLSELPDNIIVDEDSMSGMLMKKAYARVQQLTGKRFVFVGDWAQARPVDDVWGLGHPIMQNAELHILREVHRQAGGEFLDALNMLRVGNVDCRGTFEKRVRRFEDLGDLEHPPVVISATREATRLYNKTKLREAPGEAYTLPGWVKDTRSAYAMKNWPLNEATKNKMIEDSRMGVGLDFKIGCRLLITKNGAGEMYVNGDTGDLVDVDAISVQGQNPPLLVRLDRTGEVVSIPFCVKEVKSGPRTVDAEIYGYPVQLGYAQTIHSMQGQTVASAWIDMRSITRHPGASRHGLFYVAASRPRTLEGCWISEWCEDAVYSDPAVRLLIG